MAFLENNFKHTFAISDKAQIRDFFPIEKNNLEAKTKSIANRIAHWVRTGVWIDSNAVLTYSCHRKESVSSLFEGMPLETKLKRVEQGTYVPKTSWSQFSGNGLTFLKNFIQSPKTVGSIIPSFKGLAKEIVSEIPKFTSVIGAKRVILEIGPGTGSFTEKIIKRMGPDDVLHLVEFDEKFCEILTQTYRDLILTGKLVIYNQDILRFSPELKYDFIVSGLPLNAFNPEMVSKIFEKIKELSEPGKTKFSYFEYLLVPTIVKLFANTAKAAKLDRIQSIKDQFQRAHPFRNKNVYFNFPPATVRHHRIA